MDRRVNDRLIASVSGIRGVVGSALTPDVVARYAAAHGAARRAATGRSEIVVGRDARISGPALQAAAIAGLQSVGCDVIDVGPACTPSILLAIENHRSAGGIAITASHNPAEWNALKLASERGMFLTPDEGADVLRVVEEDAIPYATWEAWGRGYADGGATDDHIEAILDDDLVDPRAVDGRGFDVVIDTCAGIAAVAVVPLMKAMGVEVTGLHLEPTGRFPRNPEPIAANLTELGDRVRAEGADLGFAVDPDGDRLAIVDETGAPVGEDLTLALTVDYVLGAGAGGGRRVVTNLSTSQVVEDAARVHGAEVVRTAVGEVNVALEMIDTDSPIGGEGNGGVIYPALHHTRDAPVAMALILSHLATNGLTLDEALARFPKYAIEKAKVEVRDDETEAAVERAASAFDGAVADRTDGVRLTWPAEREWLHLRRSGTEPVVRVIAEAPEPERAAALVGEARERLGNS